MRPMHDHPWPVYWSGSYNTTKELQVFHVEMVYVSSKPTIFWGNSRVVWNCLEAYSRTQNTHCLQGVSDSFSTSEGLQPSTLGLDSGNDVSFFENISGGLWSKTWILIFWKQCLVSWKIFGIDGHEGPDPDFLEYSVVCKQYRDSA